jgi:DNA-binding response OmpR family regulator
MLMKKVLIVEDDRDINEALAIRLKAAGYAVCRAEDGLMGLVTAVHERPDLMILDISMPAGDGFSIVERAREYTDLPAIPVIFITASKRPELRKAALEMGAVAFFEKPYESAELIHAVHAALGVGQRLTL